MPEYIVPHACLDTVHDYKARMTQVSMGFWMGVSLRVFNSISQPLATLFASVIVMQHKQQASKQTNKQSTQLDLIDCE